MEGVIYISSRYIYLIDSPKCIFVNYIAFHIFSALGDPLIKGLTEVANKRPGDPIAYLATYLYNFANNKNKSRPKTQVTHQ